MRACRLLTILFFNWLPSAFAGPFPVPYSIVETGRMFKVYEVTWTIIDIPQADAPAPANYWFGSAKSTSKEDFPVVKSETCLASLCGTKSIPGETISSAAMRAFRKGPVITQHDTVLGKDDNCIAFGGIPQGSNSYSSAILPAGCALTPATNVYCMITTPDIYLNHGDINLKDLVNSKASASFSVTCSKKVTTKISLSPNLSYIEMNNNGKANILINNLTPGKKHTLPAGISSLTITSTLTDITQGGAYSGTAVLIVEPL